MASTYSPDLRIQLMANGENSGTWGTVTNTNLGTILEDAISGIANVTVTTTSQALTALNGIADESRCSTIVLTTALTTGFTIYVPPVSKLYVIANNTNYTATFSASTAAGNTTPSGGLTLGIPANSSCLIRCDGVNIREQLNRIVGNLTVDGSFSAAGGSFDGNFTMPNSAFLGAALPVSDISVATAPTPSVVTVPASPVTNAAIVFSVSSGGTLPTGITAGQTYFVSQVSATTFNFSASSTLSPLVSVSTTGTGTLTVSTVSLAITPPIDSSNTQIATTAFAKAAASQAAGTALQDPGSNGMLARTAASTTVARTITSSTGITTTNGNGVAGNPNLALQYATQTDIGGVRAYVSGTTLYLFTTA